MRKLLLLLAVAAFASCSSVVSDSPPSRTLPPEPAASSTFALGEVVNGWPSDQERMIHVLTNLSRHAPNNFCADYTAERGAAKMRPLVWTQKGNEAARFTSRHLAELGCFQHESCCTLAQLGDGGVGCTAPATCSGAACGRTCTGGTETFARYSLVGFQGTGENIARGQGSATEAWCAWVKSDGHRANIYGSSFTQLGTGGYDSPLACSGWYWTQSFGSQSVTIPAIPAASAIHEPGLPFDMRELYFAANYYDFTGKGPKRNAVVVDGRCFDLSLAYGYEDNGTFEARFTDPEAIPRGCHKYYFLFVDDAANRHVYPSSGSLKFGVGEGCPDSYDPGPQDVADCETGQQLCQAGTTQSCFGADAGVIGVGECRAGYQVCKNGFWSSCREQKLPSAEICNGADDDCDGEIDEGDPGAGQSCTVPDEFGLCQRGETHCRGGATACLPLVAPSPEVCDLQDNDCDGLVDDGFGLLTCGVGGCFRFAQACSNGDAGFCDAGTPGVEGTDNGVDDDCNGIVDDSAFCGDAGAKRNRYTFPTSFIGQRCRGGQQTCQDDGGWSPVAGEIGPTAEVCNGLDDDCDGNIDELLELGRVRCGTGICRQVLPACSSGVDASCAPAAPAAELCNGVDDSCDGVTDENCGCKVGNYRPCYTGDVTTRNVGACRDGQRPCSDGGYVATCLGEVTPTAESCGNGMDDDCDGTVDDGCAVDAGAVDAGVASDGGGGGATTEPPPEEEQGGCGCSAVPASSVSFLFAALLARRRRR